MPRIAYIFPGQGSQYVGMGKELYERSSAARELYDRADTILGFPLTKLSFEGPEDRLRQTGTTQPVLRPLKRKLRQDRKSTRLNSSHSQSSYAVFCLKKKMQQQQDVA